MWKETDASIADEVAKYSRQPMAEVERRSETSERRIARLIALSRLFDFIQLADLTAEHHDIQKVLAQLSSLENRLWMYETHGPVNPEVGKPHERLDLDSARKALFHTIKTAEEYARMCREWEDGMIEIEKRCKGIMKK